MRQRKFGRTDLVVTELGLGGSPIGNRASPISEPQSEEIIESAWNHGIRYFDTAPLYGHGLAEARLGHGLRWKPRDEFVVSSKVGRILKPASRVNRPAMLTPYRRPKLTPLISCCGR